MNKELWNVFNKNYNVGINKNVSFNKYGLELSQGLLVRKESLLWLSSKDGKVVLIKDISNSRK